jgi:hypothetical protein
MKLNILKTLTLGIALAFQACTLPEVKEAKFEYDTKQVLEKLKSLRNFEDAGISWSARSAGDKTTDILIVQFLNGKDLSDNEAELRSLGIEALKIVTGAIENERDYDKFQVVFVQRSNSGPATTSFTRPFDYSLEDLE